MADLSTMFPNFDVGSFGPVAGMAMGDMFNIAKRNSQINQDQALQEYAQKAALNPIAVDQARSTLNNTDALTGMHQSTTRLQNQTADMNDFFKDERYQKFRDEAKDAHTSSELKQALSKIEKDLMNPDPKVNGPAKLQYALTADVLKERLKLEEQRKTAESVARITGDSRVAAKNAGGVGSRVPRTLQEQYTSFLNQAENANTPEESQRYQQMADVVFKKMVELGNARSAPMAVTPDGRFVPNPGYNPGEVTPTQLPPKAGETTPKNKKPDPLGIR